MSGFFDKKNNIFEEMVYRGVESDVLDYKTHMSWRTMTRAAKGKLIRHLIAFANTRGGSLVIGVGEDQFGNPNLCTGVSTEEAGSFDPSAVGNFVNSHVEPPIDFTIERPVVRGKKYVIFTVRPFKNLPHVCTNSIEGEVQSGVFYIRTVEASSRPARRALEMQELIHRALRNQREALGDVLRSVLQDAGLAAPPPAVAVSADAIEASWHYFSRRTSGFDLPQIKLTVEPANFLPGRFSFSQLRSAMFKALKKELRFLYQNEAEALPTPGSLRYISMEARRMWQFFDSGLFCFFTVLSKPVLEYAEIIRLCAGAVDFSGLLYTALGMENENLSITLEIVNPQKLKVASDNVQYSFAAHSPCRAKLDTYAAACKAHPAEYASQLALEMGNLFKLNGLDPEQLKISAGKYLEKK